MVRSKWKLAFVDKSIFNFYEKEKKNVSNIISRAVFAVRQRSSLITELALDRRFSVPHGRGSDKFTILDSQVGMRFGSLCLTKNIGTYMHVYNKVQKKKKERQKTLKQKKLNRNKSGKKTRLKLKSQRVKLARAKLKAKKKKEI